MDILATRSFNVVLMILLLITGPYWKTVYTEYAIPYKYIKINKNEQDYDNNVYYVKDNFAITSRRILT